MKTNFLPVKNLYQLSLLDYPFIVSGNNLTENFISFDPFVIFTNKNSPELLLFFDNYDVIFNNSLNFNMLAISLVVSLLLIAFLLLQANLLNLSFYPNATFDAEKYSPYECGFSPFWTEWAQFDIKFYLIALLFLVFDVELMFLLPYCLSYFYLNFHAYTIFLLFFFILIVGFLVEWAVGMLVWKGEEKHSKENLVNFLLKSEKEKQRYLAYTVEYLGLLDFRFLRYFSSWWRENYNIKEIWKFLFVRPYTERFFSQPLAATLDKESNQYNRPVFYGVENIYMGSATISYYQIHLAQEKKETQARIERFFIWIYGEPYKTWLESLAPHEWDFVF